MRAFIKFLGTIAFAVVFLLPLSVLLLTPLLGFYFMYVLSAVLISLTIGLVWGFIMPMKALNWTPVMNMPGMALRISTPAAVRRGEVTRREPKGAAAEFGWDLAWPTYIPYQLSRDQRAVILRTRRRIWSLHDDWTHWWPQATASPWLFRWLLKLAYVVTVGILLYSLLGSIWLGVGIWLAITWATRLVVSAGQRLASRGITQWERRSMKRGESHVRCPRCYRDFQMPSFACPQNSCGIIHRDVSPGLFGIRSRQCECGRTIPHTVAKASRTLNAICPHCDEDLPRGAGGRRVVVAPVFGTVGAGKTQFLSALVSGLRDVTTPGGQRLTLTSLTDSATRFLDEAVDNANLNNAPMKTEHRDRPEALPYLVEHSSGSFELQLIDAAGESFVETERSRSLGYLDISNTLIFVFDPFSVDEIREELDNRKLSNRVQIAQGNAQDAYGSVVDRLRADNTDLKKKNLAVVISKADILGKLYPQTPMPQDSHQTRQWVYDLGADHLIRRIEMDFRQVQYFAVDSFHSDGRAAELSPLAVLDWTISNHGGQALFPAQAEPATDETTAKPSVQTS